MFQAIPLTLDTRPPNVEERRIEAEPAEVAPPAWEPSLGLERLSQARSRPAARPAVARPAVVEQEDEPDWLGRLEAFGMLVTYSSGTTGKLSFVPRSYDELGPWKFHFFNVNKAGTGVDAWVTKLPTFMPGYRGGYQTMLKMMDLFNLG